MNLDEAQVDTLQKSMATIGQLNRIIYCKDHPDFIISGRHRTKAGAQNKFGWDVEATANSLKISHALCHWVLREHANFQREITEAERKEEFIEMAKIFIAEGTPRESVCAKLGEVSTFSDRYIRQLLPDEYKHTEKQRKDESFAELAPQTTKEKLEQVRKEVGDAFVALEKNSPTKKVPYSKGTSPSLKQNNPAQFTLAQEKLFTIIHHIKGTNFLHEIPFKREGEFNSEGVEKTYQADLCDFANKLIVEAEGDAHDELDDDPERDEYFTKKGFEVLKFDNKDIDRVPHLVLKITELTVEVRRLRAELEKKREALAV